MSNTLLKQKVAGAKTTIINTADDIANMSTKDMVIGAKDITVGGSKLLFRGARFGLGACVYVGANLVAGLTKLGFEGYQDVDRVLSSSKSKTPKTHQPIKNDYK